MRRTLLTAAAVLVLAATGATAVAQQAAAGSSGPPGQARWTLVQMVIESKAFEDGGIVPLKYSFYGTNTLPDFKLSNLPANTQSIAIILHDLDVAPAYNPDDNLHWLAWNIPATVPVTQIEEGKLPEGAVNGRKADGSALEGPQTQEVWSGITLALASEMAGAGMKDEALQTARGVYNVVYRDKGYWFRTPEAWDQQGDFRASMYLRPGAMWAIDYSMK